MDLINCPDCNHEILSRMGTVCPNCGFTVGFFNGDERRKKYSKFFAITVATPFLSLVIMLSTSLNKYVLLIGFVAYIFFAYKSFPHRFKDIFVKKFDAVFFYSVWGISNIILSIAFINLLLKNFS